MHRADTGLGADGVLEPVELPEFLVDGLDILEGVVDVFFGAILYVDNVLKVVENFCGARDTFNNPVL